MEKKIQANRTAEAVKHLGEVKAKAVKVPTTINASEKDHYHVIIVDKVEVNKATLEVTCKSRIQVFNERAFQKHKKQFSQLGYADITIFHDPTIGATTKDKGKDFEGKDFEGKDIDELTIEQLKSKAIFLEIEFTEDIPTTKLVELIEAKEAELNN